MKPSELRTHLLLAIQQLHPQFRDQLSYWCRFLNSQYPALNVRQLPQPNDQSSESSDSDRDESRCSLLISPARFSVIDQKKRSAPVRLNQWRARKAHQKVVEEKMNQLEQDLKAGLISIHPGFKINPEPGPTEEEPSPEKESRHLEITFPEPATISQSSLSQLIPIVKLKESCNQLLQDAMKSTPDLPVKIQLIIRNSPLDFKATDLADKLDVSHRSLQRSLQYAGTSFGEIQQQELLWLTIQGLENPAMSLTEVAHSIGFDNVSNFGRLCRRHFGQSPKTLRKELLKLE